MRSQDCLARLVVRVALVCAALAVVLALSPGRAGAAVLEQITIVGQGTVQRPLDPRFPCPPRCQTFFIGLDPGGPFSDSLLAVPAPGWSFAGWTLSGDRPPESIAPDTCSTGVTCSFIYFLIIDPRPSPFPPPNPGHLNITATFVQTPVPPAPPVPETPEFRAPPPVVREPDRAFLCYSRFQVDPGVWPEAEAAALLAKGYWRPTAVPGAVSATRLGPYSLVCNPPNVARVVDHGFVDDGGVALAAVGDPWLGLYPLAQ